MALIEADLSIASIATQLDRSKATVRYWLKRHGLRTRTKPRTGAGTRAAKDHGFTTVSRICARHGESEFFLEGRGYYRCKRCRSEAVSRRRRRAKVTLVAEAGGRCAICGYDRYIGALEFHHLDPGEKRLPVSSQGSTLALKTLRAEARKCMLLCSNCHAEVEGGVTALPVHLAVAQESP